jgi:hypothetical protein
MRNWIFGLGLILAVGAGLAAAMQSDAGRAVAGEATAEETGEDYLNPILTPEESAAVERGIREHVQATQRRAREESGANDPRLQRTAPRSPPRSVNDYQHCMQSASQAPTAEDREIQSRACRNLPGAPAP